MDTRRASYTSANSFPYKIFKNKSVVNSLIGSGKILPVHAQIIPTNKCNLSCKFCSCRNRSKQDELTLATCEYLSSKLSHLGCRAITITGGGEPMMHDCINQIIHAFLKNWISVGIVTNGILIDRMIQVVMRGVTWCRISCADDRKFTDQTAKVIAKAWESARDVDWAFSYVVSEDFDADNLARYIEFANKHNFTHVRVVSDICDLAHTVEMDIVRQFLARLKVDDSKVIYQGRKSFTPGQEKCFISLLKPVIGADEYIYPCCGAQYAHEDQEFDLVDSMRMGHISEIDFLYKKQNIFDGSQCYRCYYKDYNDALSAMKSDIKHGEFV